MNLMRLPLGILSGIGFIGAGVTVKRNGDISGVTTAATLWMVTVLGLLFGGGNLYLGVAGSLAAIVIFGSSRWQKSACLMTITELSACAFLLTAQRGATAPAFDGQSLEDCALESPLRTFIDSDGARMCGEMAWKRNAASRHSSMHRRDSLVVWNNKSELEGIRRASALLIAYKTRLVQNIMRTQRRCLGPSLHIRLD